MKKCIGGLWLVEDNGSCLGVNVLIFFLNVIQNNNKKK